MDAAEALVRMDEMGAVNLVPTLRHAFGYGSCPIPGTTSTLVCNVADRDDPRFSIVPRNATERGLP